MEKHIGHRVPFPDVSNTRYGSHGHAAATILIYREHFLSFMDAIRDAKDRPGETNIEKNFSEALKDIPTLTELAVLSLYFITVSQPFMVHVRKNHNILRLREFFERKIMFLQNIINDPSLLTGDTISCKTALLDGEEWSETAAKLISVIQALKPTLPDLDNILAAFFRGAHQTFVERFSDEFREGSGIDTMTTVELDQLYFSATNDSNEGGLGSWRCGQARRPAESLQKFNASFLATRNDTESFMAHKLNDEGNQAYLRGTARDRDRSGHQKKIIEAQIRADEVKIRENRQKVANRAEKRDQTVAALLKTVSELAVTEEEVEQIKLKTDLNSQLDCYREIEKILMPADIAPLTREPADRHSGRDVQLETVPAKSKIKTNPERIHELKQAAGRFRAHGGTKEKATSMLFSCFKLPETVEIAYVNAATVVNHPGDALYISDDEDL